MNKLPVLKENDIASLIYVNRGEKVMLDADIARLYECRNKDIKARSQWEFVEVSG